MYHKSVRIFSVWRLRLGYTNSDDEEEARERRRRAREERKKMRELEESGTTDGINTNRYDIVKVCWWKEDEYM